MEDNSASPKVKDVWVSGEVYESYVGRWSVLLAHKFLAWLAVPPQQAWLDVGCGTGALTRAILQDTAPRLVKGIDRSQGFIAYAAAHIADPRANFEVGDAQDLPVEDGVYDAVVSGLMLNFVPQPDQAVNEMQRACKLGGVVAALVWDYAGRMQFMRHFWNAAAALDPPAAELDEGRRFPLCSPDALSDLLLNAGLSQVEVQPMDIWMVFKDFEDFWSPFLGGQGPAPSYVASLKPDRQVLLRERLRSALPTSVDGSIPLMSRAWAVRGSV